MPAHPPVVLESDAPGLNAAVALLAAGEIIAAPTDTVYGIAAQLDRPEALRRLYLAKGRPDAKSIPILLGDPDVASRLSSDLRGLDTLAAAFWPGALTIVTRARGGLPAEVLTQREDGTATVALRLPDNEIMRELCRRSGGALAVTSANVSGEPAAISAEAVHAFQMPYLGAILNGGVTPGPLPSTIVSVAGHALHLIREGVIPWSRVISVWQQANDQADMRGMICE